MPPTVRFTRDAVLHAACQLMRREGMEALNARAIAKELGGSTQPIFRLFTNMEDLHRELILYVARQFQAHAEADMAQSDSPYIQLCTTYLLYGRDEPELFKLLFMRDRVSEGNTATRRILTLCSTSSRRKRRWTTKPPCASLSAHGCSFMGWRSALRRSTFPVRMKDTSSAWSRKPTTPPLR